MKPLLLLFLFLATAFSADPSANMSELLSGTVTHVSKDGIFLKAVLIPENYKELVAADIAEQKKWRQAVEIDGSQFTKPLGEIFLSGDFPDLVDGAKWKGQAVADGRFQFTTTSGATRTVPKWIAQ